MMYYVRWNGAGGLCQETFDNVTDAQRSARATSRIPWIKEAYIIDENGVVVNHYVLGFVDE